MVYEVKVRQPLATLDLGIVERALGEPPLDLRSKDHIPAPFITIDGRINATTSFYLRHHCRSRPHLGTAALKGDNLATSNRRETRLPVLPALPWRHP